MNFSRRHSSLHIKKLPDLFLIITHTHTHITLVVKKVLSNKMLSKYYNNLAKLGSGPKQSPTVTKLNKAK